MNAIIHTAYSNDDFALRNICKHDFTTQKHLSVYVNS